MQNQRGLSLIEIIVSFSIIAFSFIALVQSFPLALNLNKTSENATKASYLAQEKIEQLYSLGYAGFSTGVIEAKARLSADPTNYLYNFQRQTTVDFVDGNLQISGSDTGMKKISVTVYYTNSFTRSEKGYLTTTLISQW